MALPVIENCFRVTWNFSGFSGVTPRIVNHYLAPGFTDAQVGQRIDDSMENGLFEPMPAGFAPTSIDVLALDGTSPTRNHALENETTPCEGSGQTIPAAAFLMALQTNQRGPRGRGRMFVGPIGEATQAEGIAETTPLANLEGAWAGFLANLGAPEPMYLAVASYTHAVAEPVTGIRFERVLATQRRRQNQLR
jgi:hypothetical protein